MSHGVALIGVGAMGQALLMRLRAVNKDVQAYDVSPGALCAASAGGATAFKSPAAASHMVPYVHILVASDDETKDAVLGVEGVLEGAAPGSIVFLHGTILPSTTKKIAQAAAKYQVDVLDAPITAVPHQLQTGKAAFMLGGSAELVSKVRQHLLQLGDAVHHYGPLGAGNVAKLARALLNAGERVLLAEVLALVEAGGLDPTQFLKVESAAKRPSKLSLWEDIFNFENGHARHRPATNLFKKDILLAAKLADGYGLNAPLTQGAASTAVKWVREWTNAKSVGKC